VNRCKFNRSKTKLFLISCIYYICISRLQDVFNASSDYSRPMPGLEEMQDGRPNQNQPQPVSIFFSPKETE
jgi:hypothetical protein